MSERIKPTYPSRRETILGMAAFRESGKRISDVFESELFPLKYTCTLTTKSGMMISAVIVSHCELEDYCLLKGFQLFTLDQPVELALPNERSTFC